MTRPRFDKTLADRVLIAVRAGASNEVAAVHAGTEVAIIRDWLKGGTAGKDEFKAAAGKARADLQLLAIGSIRRNVTDDTAAAMYIAQSIQGDAELERLRDLTT